MDTQIHAHAGSNTGDVYKKTAKISKSRASHCLRVDPAANMTLFSKSVVYMSHQWRWALKRNLAFIKDVGTLISGNVFARALSFVFAPLVTRLYTTEDYGVLALFIALTGIFNQWSSLTYNQAIILAQGDEEALQVMVLSILCLLAVCSCTVLASFVRLLFFRHL